MKIVDTKNWNRKEHFDFFSQFDEPFFGLVSEVDCTAAHKTSSENNYSFFSYYLHKSLIAVNKVKEFKYRISDDKVIFYDEIDPPLRLGVCSLALSWPQPTIRSLWTDGTTRTGKAMRWNIVTVAVVVAVAVTALTVGYARLQTASRAGCQAGGDLLTNATAQSPAASNISPVERPLAQPAGGAKSPAPQSAGPGEGALPPALLSLVDATKEGIHPKDVTELAAGRQNALIRRVSSTSFANCGTTPRCSQSCRGLARPCGTTAVASIHSRPAPPAAKRR